MLKLAVSALAGVLVLQQLPTLPRPGWVVPLLILTLPLRCRWARQWLLPGLAGFAWAWWVAVHGLAARLPDHLHGQDVRLTGYVASFVSGNEARLSFTFQLHGDYPVTDMPRRWRLTWYRPTHQLAPGQNLAVTVRARQARTLGNPVSFDYQGWLLREGLSGTGYVRELTPISRAQASLPQWWLRQRAALYGRLQSVAGEQAPILGALAVGARHEFTNHHWGVLQRTGTSHLVAISGLHVGLVALGSFGLLRAGLLRVPWLSVGLRATDLAAGASLAVAACYSALAGFGIPAQRALVMVLVAALALLARRRPESGEALGLALLVVLLLDPRAVLSAGFWLSFGAVATLWLAFNAQRLAAPTDQQPGPWIVTLVRTQWVIALGLMPALVLFFGELALLAPLINLLAVPWFSFVLVPASLGLVVLVTLLPDLAGLPGAGMDGLLAGTWAVLATLAEVPWANVAVPSRPWPLLGLAVAGIAAFLLGRGFAGRGLYLLLLGPLVTWRAPALQFGQMRLTVLDVGQGLAALVETRDHVLVYDAGPAMAGGYDAGASIVVPTLRARGWRRLDALVIGHGDQDHSGGAAAVLGAFPGSAVWIGPDVDLPGQRCRSGQGWVWDGVAFAFLHPADTRFRDDNDGSCVLRVASGGRAVLLTGDIERAAEATLLARGVPLSADVVVVPHHGSATSSTASFVAAVRPTFAVVPAGFRNRWGMPRREVVERWQASGSEVLVTGQVGSVGVLLGPAGVRLERVGRRRRYWHAL